MSATQMAACFNEWMRRYIEEPERFNREYQDVLAFLRDEATGVEPTYGQECAAYLQRLASEGIGADAE